VSAVEAPKAEPAAQEHASLPVQTERDTLQQQMSTGLEYTPEYNENYEYDEEFAEEEYYYEDEGGLYDVDYDVGGGHKGLQLSASNVMKQVTAGQHSSANSNHTNTNISSSSTAKAVGLKRLNANIVLDKEDTRGNLKTENKTRTRTKDKSDRATTDQVLDQRTRLILLRFINQKVFVSLQGCISTGKEANVYQAVMEDGGSLAVKVYKTSILVFKDRDRYVSGEFRWRFGYNKKNPRKMVKLWAEKEMRNLRRLYAHGIFCPEVVALRNHVLIMKFIGEDGMAAPRLKDAVLSESRMHQMYLQIVKDMRTMFTKCKLVHADLSEYNILYYKKKLWIIDVSQSVEHDHPRAQVFLKMDCFNVTNYFYSQGVGTMSVQDLYEFVTNPNLPDSQIDDYLAGIEEKTRGKAKGDIFDAVFLATFEPTRLDQIDDIEREDAIVNDAKREQSAFTRYIQKNTRQDSAAIDEEGEEEQDEDWDEEDDGEGGKGQPSKICKSWTVTGTCEYKGACKYEHPEMSEKERRKANKAQVKAENKEKRKNKMKKHLKRAHVKKGSGKKV
jgi:RIO kinase 1